MPGRFAGHLAVVVAAAVGIRIAYVLAVADDIPTIGDAETYHLLAAHLADGHGYVRPHELALTGTEIPTAEFPPLFPGLLAAADLARADTVLAQKLVLAVLGGITVALVGLLGRAVSRPAVGLVAAAVAALHPALFGAEGALMAEALYVPLVTAALLLAWRARESPGRGTWLALGLVVGAAALTRAEALLLVPLVVLPLAAGTRSLPGIARAWRAGYAVLGVLLVVGPWTVRNALVLDHFVPVSNNLGGLVVGANCPRTYEGDFKGLWLFECYGRVDATGLDESERADAFLDAGVDHARDNAGEVPGVVAVRLLRTWGLWDPTGQIAWETLEGRDRTWHTVAHRAHVLLLLPAAVAGAVVARRRRILQWPLLATLAMACVVTVAAYGNQRFRAAAEPALAVLAAIAVVAAVRAARARLRAGRAGAAAGTATALAVLLVAGACASGDRGPDPAAVQAPTAPEPQTVLVLGDSVVYDAVPAIEAALESTGAYEVHATPVLGHGLGKVDTFEWREGWRYELDRHRPAVVVVMVGAWDTLPPVVGGHALDHATPEWAAWYGGLLDEAASLLTSGGARVEWLGLPHLATPGTDDRVDAINAAIAALGDRHPRVRFLDAASALAPRAPASVLRKPDGVHLCPEGAERVARLVLGSLGERGSPRPRLGWEEGAWRLDRRYVDPDIGPACEPE